MDVQLSIRVEVEGGASLNNASATGRTAEQQDQEKVNAATNKLADVIKGANVEDIISAIETLACQADSSAVFNNRRISRGSLLHVAAATGKSTILRLLLDRVDAYLITAQDDWGNTPLHIATKAKGLEDVAMLIRHARYLPDVDDKNWILRIKNNHGNTALHEAVLIRDVDLVRHLLKENPELVYSTNADQKSPLYLAIDTCDPKIFEVLFSPSLNPSRIEGLPPVHGAVAREQYDSLGKILKNNMGLFAMRDSGGGNVFHLAAFWNMPKVFKLLRPETQYLAQEQDNNGDLPIHIASKRDHVALIEKLHPVSKWLNGQGQTILHVAAKYGSKWVVRYVLRHPDMREMINERDCDGNTPSHLAAKYLQPAPLVYLVLDDVMNPFLLNYEGLTAVDSVPNHARNGLQQILVRWLLESISFKNSDLLILKPEARDKEYVNRRLTDRKVVDDSINTLLVVATLVTTVSFAAGFTVPGGLNGSDMASKDDRGMATMLDNRMFQAFVICNTIAMICSMSSVIGFMFAFITADHIAVVGCVLAGVLLTISLPAMSAAFLIGVTLTIGKLPRLATTILLLGSIFILIISFACLPPCAFYLSRCLPFIRNHLRPIRPLISGFFLFYIALFRFEKRLFYKDSKEDNGEQDLC